MSVNILVCNSRLNSYVYYNTSREPPEMHHWCVPRFSHFKGSDTTPDNDQFLFSDADHKIPFEDMCCPMNAPGFFHQTIQNYEEDDQHQANTGWDYLTARNHLLENKILILINT